jgi:sterol desaturase/sphingolipid hydroxylase (fatty acid hydroxylase superfamily)
MPKRPSNIPFRVYKREQARISRRRLYPFTIFYTLYAAAVLFFTLRSAHPVVGVGFFLLGIPIWTFNEYFFHRFVLHGRFPPGDNFVRRFMHERLDPLHWEHHERPFDGMHISGQLKDFLPLFLPAAALCLIFPVYTLTALLAGVVQSYVVEEWVHHSVHFYDFKNPYFKYIKRYHLYHHGPKGMDAGFGLTSGIWDAIFKTRFSDPPRQKQMQEANAVTFKASSN